MSFELGLVSVHEEVVCENTRFNQDRPDAPKKVEKYMGIFERRMSEGSMGAESLDDKKKNVGLALIFYH